MCPIVDTSLHWKCSTQEFLKRHHRKDPVNFVCIARHFCRLVRFSNIGNCGLEVAEGKQQMALIVTTFKNHNLKSLIKHTTSVRENLFLNPITMGNNDNWSDSEKYGEEKKFDFWIYDKKFAFKGAGWCRSCTAGWCVENWFVEKLKPN